jgi:hypothetical protein
VYEVFGVSWSMGTETGCSPVSPAVKSTSLPTGLAPVREVPVGTARTCTNPAFPSEVTVPFTTNPVVVVPVGALSVSVQPAVVGVVVVVVVACPDAGVVAGSKAMAMAMAAAMIAPVRPRVRTCRRRCRGPPDEFFECADEFFECAARRLTNSD